MTKTKERIESILILVLFYIIVIMGGLLVSSRITELAQKDLSGINLYEIN